LYENGIIKDPYLLLEPINKEIPDEEIELLFDDEYLKEGGAATIAYAKLQFIHMKWTRSIDQAIKIVQQG
jgi:hypothetical protein